jgi:hypothetical protein
VIQKNKKRFIKKGLIKMTIEIYLLKGLETINADNHNLLQSILGISGSTNPYQLMNKSYENIFTELCPVKEDYKKYQANAIPEQVMELIIAADAHSHFCSYQIWYDDATPDPLLVGFDSCYVRPKVWANGETFKTVKDANEFIATKPESEGWHIHDFISGKKYILARWGDEMRPLKELSKIANDKFVTRTSYELKKRIIQAQGDLELLSLEANQKFLVN